MILALTAALAGTVDVPAADGVLRITLAEGDADAPLVVTADLRAAAVIVALERGDAWTGRQLAADRPVQADGAVVLGLDLLRTGTTFPTDLGVLGAFLPDGSLVPTAGAAEQAAALLAQGRKRLIVPPGLSALATRAGAEVIVAHHLSEASALATGAAWDEPAPPPPLPADVLHEVEADLKKAADRVGEPAQWRLPGGLEQELVARRRVAKRQAGSAAAWWAWLDAEALPYGWTLAMRALGGDMAQLGPRMQAMATAMDGRLERHLRGPSDALPAARAGLAHGLVMERARAACEALASDDEPELGALVSLAEAQARAELGSLYVTDGMIRRTSALTTHQAGAAAALLSGAQGLDGLDGCLGPLSARLTAALTPEAPVADWTADWTAVDAAFGFGWVLAQDGPDDDELARAAASRALSEALAVGLVCDVERLELAAVEDPVSLREIALRARVMRLVLRAPQ
jgi:hypothetical protein